jgi:hypothetical protein
MRRSQRRTERRSSLGEYFKLSMAAQLDGYLTLVLIGMDDLHGMHCEGESAYGDG